MSPPVCFWLKRQHLCSLFAVETDGVRLVTVPALLSATIHMEHSVIPNVFDGTCLRTVLVTMRFKNIACTFRVLPRHLQYSWSAIIVCGRLCHCCNILYVLYQCCSNTLAVLRLCVAHNVALMGTADLLPIGKAASSAGHRKHHTQRWYGRRVRPVRGRWRYVRNCPVYRKELFEDVGLLLLGK